MVVTLDDIAKAAAKQAMDFVYDGKTISEWTKILADYEDKKTTLERIANRLNEELDYSVKNFKNEEVFYRKGIRFVRKLIQEELSKEGE